MSFGEQFQDQIVEMEMTKQAQGSNVKSFSFKAVITCPDEDHREVFNQCVHWRQYQQEKNEFQNMS